MSKYWDKIKFYLRRGGGYSFGGQLLYVFKILFSTKIFVLSRKVLKTIFKKIYIKLEEWPVIIIHAGEQNVTTQPVDLKTAEIEYIRRNIGYFKNDIKFSIIVPVYNTPAAFLRQMVESIKGQLYENWELCIADDCSTQPEVKQILDEYAAADNRIKVVYRTTNGHISATSNSALELCTGDFTFLLDHDDFIEETALYYYYDAICKLDKVDLLYSDEDKFVGGYFRDAYYKSGWCPDNLLSRNYICHGVMVRTSLLKEVGGFRIGFEGSQDHDLLLRLTEKTENIYHIPRVLYHWRMHQESTAMNGEAKMYAYDSAERAINEAIIRRGEKGSCKMIDGILGHYYVTYDIIANPKVSIVIPSKDHHKVLERCVKSIVKKTTYKNYEVLIVNNNSTEPETERTLLELEKYPQVRRVDVKTDTFNFSYIMNFGVGLTDGEYVVSLNNDTEIITPNWIEQMLMQAQRKSIGVVGCKLLYPNDTIQHAGVVIGIGGIAGHTFVGFDKDALGRYNLAAIHNNYSALTGACFMLKRSIYNEVGGFDEDLKVEFNDIDLCLKVRELGYDNIYVPDAVLYHYESLSRGLPTATKASTEQHHHDVKTFMDRWKKYIEADPCYNINLSLWHCDWTPKQVMSA